MLRFILYFIIGGLIVSLTTYFGSKGQSFLAAIISMFPSMSVVIFVLLYSTGGQSSVIGYAKNLVYGVPPWLLYVATVAVLCQRIGIALSLLSGVGLYLAVSMGLGYLIK
jgi:uncharacterized membrane protein (GlpM family)